MLQSSKLIQGWCTDARHVISSHKNERPNNEIRLLVIHNISLPEGQFGTNCVEELFLGCLDCNADDSFASLEGLRVSSHFFIRRDGEMVQFVSCEERAWHAGVSQFNGEHNCNDFSIGIELEGTDNSPFTEAQYKELINLTRQLMQSYPQISIDNVVGHSDIAPERKTDPGRYFDWKKYKQALLEG